MPVDDTHRLGYKAVDRDPNAAVLVANMDATSQWPATIKLRDWERRNLRLGQGERLLDVGCGRGEAALALSPDLGSTGEVVGLDASTEMLDVARANLSTAACRVALTQGSAMQLNFADNSFDAVRCERVLQWLPAPTVAVAEMQRVLHPRGRMALIDSDWSTLSIDVADADISERVHEAMRVERRRPSNVGRRLGELAQRAGFMSLQQHLATNTWTEWNPSSTPAPLGCFSMRSLAEDLVERGQLASDEIDQFVTRIETAASEGHFTMSLTMYAIVGVRA